MTRISVVSALTVLLVSAALLAQQKQPSPKTTIANLDKMTAAGRSQKEMAQYVFDNHGCTSCHTLADAGSTGTVGPNLDQVKPSHDLVVTRVTNGKGQMPPFKGKLTKAQIEAVVKYEREKL